MSTKILVLGANGQLGKSIKAYTTFYKIDAEIIYTSRTEIDITDFINFENTIKSIQPKYIINCTAYTAVDKAESEFEIANLVNNIAVEKLAQLSKLYNCTLIHISTDFVFDGTKNTPLHEEDVCNPIGVYGKTKYDGEQAIINNFKNYYIIRTSWLYSTIGANFFTNISKYAKDRASLNIVFDQVGTPTYTMDLVDVIFKIINSKTNYFGIYHYSNEGVCSWYDFAKELVSIQNIECDILPILSAQYPTPAKRPAYSVMNKNKIKSTFNIQIPHWRDSMISLYKQMSASN